MQQQNELSFSELLTHILHGWRLMVGLVLGLALVLAALGVVANRRLSFSDAVLDARIPELAKTHPELAALVTSIDSKKAETDRLSAYMAESVYFNLDAQAVATASIELDIDLAQNNRLFRTEKEAVLHNLVNQYANAIHDEAFLTKVLEQTGQVLSTQYIGELITVTTVEDLHNRLILSVSHRTADEALQVVYSVYSYFSNVLKPSFQMVHEHALVFSQMTQKTAEDTQLAELKQQKLSQQQALQTSIDADRAQLRSKTRAILTQQSSTSIPQRIMMGIILGVIFGAGVMTADLLLHPIIRSQADVRRRLGLTVLAELHHPDQRKTRKSLRFVLLAWSWLLGQNEAHPVQMVSMDYAAASLQQVATTKQQPGHVIRQIACLGTVSSGHDINPICTALKMQQPADFGLVAVADIFNDAQAVAAIGQCEQIVLVERAGTSRVRDIEDLLAFLQRYHKPVIGLFLLRS